MVKRKSGVRVAAMMLVMMVMFIIMAMPALAASEEIEKNYNRIEVTIEDLTVSLKNTVDESWMADIEIIYYDEASNDIYTKTLKISLSEKETQTVNAKDYFDSERTQRIEVNILKEYSKELYDFNNRMFAIIGGLLIACFIISVIRVLVQAL